MPPEGGAQSLSGTLWLRPADTCGPLLHLSRVISSPTYLSTSCLPWHRSCWLPLEENLSSWVQSEWRDEGRPSLCERFNRFYVVWKSHRSTGAQKKAHHTTVRHNRFHSGCWFCRSQQMCVFIRISGSSFEDFKANILSSHLKFISTSYVCKELQNQTS